MVHLGQKVKHKEIYEGREVMEVVGIKKDEVLLKGDFSGGTHNVEQESWLPLKGLIVEPIESTFYDRLLTETRELAEKANKLNDFMRTQGFADLDRQNKDLLYEQSRHMSNYLQVLGHRLEILGKKFTFEKKCDGFCGMSYCDENGCLDKKEIVDENNTQSSIAC